MRAWLRLIPLVALSLGLTWSGGSASADDVAPAASPELPAAPQLPDAIAVDAPDVTPDPDFRFTCVRRF